MTKLQRKILLLKTIPIIIVFLTGLLFADLSSADETQNDDLVGKVMCGYQGWYRTGGDGTGCGWHHYSSRKHLTTDNCVIDVWPDVSEFPKEDLFPTPFRHPGGEVAQVFSSTKPSTTDVHFKWMKEYGIDGVFLQRFAVSTRNKAHRRAMNKVLANVQSSAKKFDRKWVLMYDLSGLKSGEMKFLLEDWKKLKDEFSIGDRKKDQSYLYHNGKPLISLWGIGFTNRSTTLEEWDELVKFFKEQNFSVMLGVPTYWRTLRRDCIADPKLHKILESVDVISPWTVGRYQNSKSAAVYSAGTFSADMKWCQERKIDLLPVAFPGFSWQNLMRTRGKTAKLNAIPRRGGRFFWSQCWNYHKAGSKMLYVAMFDELDESTAIMKLSTNPPSTEKTKFVSEPDIPNDQYLWLTGLAGKMIRKERVFKTAELPKR